MKVESRWFIQPPSLLHLFLTNEILPKKGHQRELIEQFAGESPLVSFVHAILSDELQWTEEYGEGVADLSTFAGFLDLKAAAARLITQFESLPWDYTVSFPMPQPFNEVFCAHIRNYVVSDAIRIVKADDEHQRTFSLKSGNPKVDMEVGSAGMLSSILLGGETAKWEDGAYIQIRIQGFIGRYGLGTSFAQTVATVKAFCGLGIALRLFVVERKYSPSQ